MVVGRKPDHRGKEGLASPTCLALLISLARSGGREWATWSKGGFLFLEQKMCHIEINRRKETGRCDRWGEGCSQWRKVPEKMESKGVVGEKVQRSEEKETKLPSLRQGMSGTSLNRVLKQFKELR